MAYNQSEKRNLQAIPTRSFAMAEAKKFILQQSLNVDSKAFLTDRSSHRKEDYSQSRYH